MEPAQFGQLGKDIISLVEQHAAGKWPDAEALQKKAMYQVSVLMEENSQKDRPKVKKRFDECSCRCGNLLASVLTAQGRWQQAEILIRELWHLAHVTLPDGDPDVLVSIDNLADVLQRQGKLQEYEKMKRIAVQIRWECLGEDHIHTLTRKNNLANVLCKQGKWQQAEEMCREVLHGMRQVFGEHHPDTLRSRGNLANVLQEQGKWQQAEEMCKTVLEVRRQVLGEHHPDTLTSRHNLAVFLQQQGKWQQAEEMHKEVLEVMRQVLGEHHPDTLTSRGNLANVLQEQGKWQQAEEMCKTVLEVRRQVLGEHHPDTLTSRGNLANVLQKQGKWQQAEEMHKEVLEVMRQVLGEHHPDTLTSRGNLANVLQQRDRDDWKFRFSLDESSHCSRLSDAIAKLRTAIGVQKHRVDDDHPQLLVQSLLLAELVLQQNEASSLQEAGELLQPLVHALRKRYGPKHHLTQRATGDLVFLLEEQGRDAEELRKHLPQTEGEADSTVALSEQQCLEEILLGEGWEGSEEAAELLRDFVRKQQERYLGFGLMAGSSEPSSDRKSASKSRSSDRPPDAPAASSSGSASQSSSNSVPSESCLRPLRSCESSDDATSSDSSAWLKAALEEKCLEIQERERQPEI